MRPVIPTTLLDASLWKKSAKGDGYSEANGGIIYT